MKTRAKFVVQSITRTLHSTYHPRTGKSTMGEIQTINLTPVYGNGSQENEKFFAATPTGSIALGVVNKEVGDSFQIGGAYYVDFSPAE